MAKQSPLEGYMNALGRATHTWAVLEIAVDFIVVVTFNKMGGKTKAHPVIPKEIKRKLRYLKATAKLKSTADFGERIRALALAIGKLKEERHTAIHGAALEFDSAGAATVHRILHAPTTLNAQTKKSSAAKLMELARQSQNLSLEAITLVQDLIKHLGLQTGDDPAG